jgi:hypothetical protein
LEATERELCRLYPYGDSRAVFIWVLLKKYRNTKNLNKYKEGEMAKHLYHDGYPYKLKIPRDEDKGKHYFPVYGRDGRILYWVRRDLLEKIPWIYFSVPGFVEEDLVLEYDDFLVPDFDIKTFEQVLNEADAARDARFMEDLGKIKQAREMMGVMQAHGVPIGGNAGSGGIWWLLAFVIIIFLGFYWSATVYVFPKVLIRGITKSTNISLPWGNVCRTPTGTSPQDILRDASNLFDISIVDFDPNFAGIEPVMSGRCFDGVVLKGATITHVKGRAAALVTMTGVADMPPVLPGIQKGQGGCIFPLPAHPGKGFCQNVGPIQGDVQLVVDADYWLFVNEPDLQPAGGGQGPPEAQPTAVVK